MTITHAVAGVLLAAAGGILGAAAVAGVTRSPVAGVRLAAASMVPAVVSITLDGFWQAAVLLGVFAAAWVAVAFRMGGAR